MEDLDPTPQDLLRWNYLTDILPGLKEEEMALRRRLFKFAVPIPKEGTNVADESIAARLGVANGFVIKGAYKLDRSVEDAVFQNLKPALRNRGISPDLLVNYKPSLAVTVYRQLTEEDRTFFDQCITTKPGAPTLEIAQPKRPVKK